MRRKIIAIVISLIILILAVMLVIMPKKNFSDNENRYLQKFPKFQFETLLSGEYIPQIEKYLSDHFPLRNELMSLKTSVYKKIGQTKINGVYIAKDEYLIEEYTKPINSDRIIRQVNNFITKLEDCKTYFMLVPTSVSINSDKLPEFSINANQLDTIDYYYKNVNNVKIIDVYNAFESLKNEVQLYYRLDHHWTTLGAYVAYLEYCEKLQIKPETNLILKEISNDFRGTIYSKIIDNTLTPDTMHSMTKPNAKYKVNYVATNRTTNTLYEEKYLSQKDKYSYFLDNNNPLVVIENETLTNSKQIVVIKDSYANAFIPFLTNNYQKIHVIDPRYYKNSISNYIKENKIKEVLFLYNANTIDTDLGIIAIQ